MKICAAAAPPEEHLEGRRRVQCWRHSATGAIPAGQNAPLEREEISVAFEA
jgi:peptide/nickel transport system ATP-binding protein